MEYCPHCSARLSREDLRKCPYCKKNLDLNDWMAVVQPGETSEINTNAKRKIWFRENSSKIIPVLTLIAGFILGAILLYGYAQIQFTDEKTEFNNQISQLKNTILQNEENAATEKSELQNKLVKKDEIIDLLTEQNATLSSIINFTRRLARNSTITPNSPNEADYFKRNFRYLRNQYIKHTEALSETEYQQKSTPNLITVPQIIAE